MQTVTVTVKGAGRHEFSGPSGAVVLVPGQNVVAAESWAALRDAQTPSGAVVRAMLAERSLVEVAPPAPKAEKKAPEAGPPAAAPPAPAAPPAGDSKPEAPAAPLAAPAAPPAPPAPKAEGKPRK
jgi:hypothetical protein